MSSESVDQENVGEERVTDFDDPNPGNAPVTKKSPHWSNTNWDKTPLDEEKSD